MQLYTSDGALVAANDDGSYADCGKCSFLRFTVPGQRRHLAAASLVSYDLVAGCVQNATCSWQLQYQILPTTFPPPSPPPSPEPTISEVVLRCLSPNAVRLPYNVATVQLAQLMTLTQLAQYVSELGNNTGVVATLMVSPENATSIIDFLEQIANITQDLKVKVWSACVPQGALLSLSMSTLGNINISLTTLEGIRALTKLVHAATTLSNVTLLPTSQAAAIAILSRIVTTGVNFTADVAQCTVTTLSVLANVAIQSGNFNTLPPIPGVLDTAAHTQALQLASASSSSHVLPAPLITVSPLISTFVGQDPRSFSATNLVSGASMNMSWGVPNDKVLTPTSCDCNACTSTGQTARPSPSYFNLTSLSALTNGTPVVARYFALGFDPYIAAYGGLRFAIPGSSVGVVQQYNTTGVSRLVLENGTDGTVIAAPLLPAPIFFSMPAIDASGDAQAACGFWNKTTERYAKTRVVTLPDPRPQEHDVFFSQDFGTCDDASVARAWSVTGPLVDENCSIGILDCSQPENERLWLLYDGEYEQYPHNMLYLDPLHVLDFPAVACPGDEAPIVVGNVTLAATRSDQPILRVYYGSNCMLWQPNVYNCSWDAVLQAFTGGGCVPTNAPVHCATCHVRAHRVARHLLAKSTDALAARLFTQLTDFVSARVPKLSVCTPSDMTSFTPVDVWNRLRLLFYVLLGLFCGMNVGAVIGYFIDSSQQRSTLHRLQRTGTGFRKLHAGGEVWTWTCVQNPLKHELETPSGSAWELCSVFGMPFVRLRAALPEECFAGSMGEAVGRRASLSVRRLDDAKYTHLEVMRRVVRALHGCVARRVQRRIPRTDEDEDEAIRQSAPARGATNALLQLDGDVAVRGLRRDVAAARHTSKQGRLRRDVVAPVPDVPPDAGGDAIDGSARFVGTALVLAWLANTNTIPSLELARLRSAAVEHFRGVLLHGIDHTFERLICLFTVMFLPGNLNCQSDWMIKARLWRFILLQRADGGWDLTESLAFALEAHAGQLPPVPEKSVLRRRIEALLRFVLPFLVEQDIDVDEDDGDDQETYSRAAKAKRHGAREIDDCPLTFSAAAIMHAMPSELLVSTAHSRHGKAHSRRSPGVLDAPSRGVSRAVRLHDTYRNSTNLEHAPHRDAAHLDAPAPPSSTPPWPVAELSRAFISLADVRPWSVIPDFSGGLQPIPVQGESEHTLAVSPSRTQTSALIPKSYPPQPAESSMLTFVPGLLGGLQHIDVKERQDANMLPPPHAVASRRGEWHGQGHMARERPRTKERSRPIVDAERIWATVLAMRVLEQLDISWLCDEEHTIVDRGREFLKAHSRADGRVHRLLRDGILEQAADDALKRWRKVLSRHIRVVRGNPVINMYTALKHFQRASMRIVLSCMTEHETLATFLDSEAELKRWQRFMVLITLVLTTLLTAIWFYSSKAIACCAEMRAILGCTAGPCRGVIADCGDLQLQFTDVQGPPYYDYDGQPHPYLDDYGALHRRCTRHIMRWSNVSVPSPHSLQSATPFPTTRMLPTRYSWH